MKKMKIIYFFVVFLLLFILSISVKSQILLKNEDRNKIISIEINDRIKVVYRTEKKHYDLYANLFYGKNKINRFGKLISYTDSSLVFRHGIFHKIDTIKIADICYLNKFNSGIRIGVSVITTTGLLLILTSAAIVDSPVLILYGVAGIWGITIIDDKIVYPQRKINNGKWIIEVKK